MALRWRDFPDLKKPEPEPEVKPSPAPETDARIDAIVTQLKQLEASILVSKQDDAQINELIEEVRKIKSEPAPAAIATPAASEWVFDVERGPYNEIKQVNARRRSTLDRTH